MDYRETVTSGGKQKSEVPVLINGLFLDIVNPDAHVKPVIDGILCVRILIR